VYDMYPWNDHADSGTAEPHYPPADPAGPATRATRATQATQAARAVQVALDRRDNGGDAEAGQPATPLMTLPTTGRTRQ